jgi:hypothetical protein
MRKFMLLFSLVALVAPLAAFADAAPTPAQTANQICTQSKTQMGADAFKQAYGTNANKSNAWGKCVAKNAKNAQQDVAGANASCKAQQADANFATEAGHDGKTFDQFYGKTGKGGSANAFGKCVSLAVQSAVAAQAKASASAAKTCKAALKADKAAFATKYGTGRDALGKCVAQTSTSKQ